MFRWTVAMASSSSSSSSSSLSRHLTVRLLMSWLLLPWICLQFNNVEMAPTTTTQAPPSKVITYSFAYDVGSHYHNERKDYSGQVKGEYGYWLPDGFFRIFNYTADKGGYRVNQKKYRDYEYYGPDFKGFGDRIDGTAAKPSTDGQGHGDLSGSGLFPGSGSGTPGTRPGQDVHGSSSDPYSQGGHGTDTAGTGTQGREDYRPGTHGGGSGVQGTQDSGQGISDSDYGLHLNGNGNGNGEGLQGSGSGQVTQTSVPSSQDTQGNGLPITPGANGQGPTPSGTGQGQGNGIQGSGSEHDTGIGGTGQGNGIYGGSTDQGTRLPTGPGQGASVTESDQGGHTAGAGQDPSVSDGGQIPSITDKDQDPTVSVDGQGSHTSDGRPGVQSDSTDYEGVQGSGTVKVTEAPARSPDAGHGTRAPETDPSASHGTRAPEIDPSASHGIGDPETGTGAGQGTRAPQTGPGADQGTRIPETGPRPQGTAAAPGTQVTDTTSQGPSSGSKTDVDQGTRYPETSPGTQGTATDPKTQVTDTTSQDPLDASEQGTSVSGTKPGSETNGDSVDVSDSPGNGSQDEHDINGEHQNGGSLVGSDTVHSETFVTGSAAGDERTTKSPTFATRSTIAPTSVTKTTAQDPHTDSELEGRGSINVDDENGDSKTPSAETTITGGIQTNPWYPAAGPDDSEDTQPGTGQVPNQRGSTSGSETSESNTINGQGSSSSSSTASSDEGVPPLAIFPGFSTTEASRPVPRPATRVTSEPGGPTLTATPQPPLVTWKSSIDQGTSPASIESGTRSTPPPTGTAGEVPQPSHPGESVPPSFLWTTPKSQQDTCQNSRMFTPMQFPDNLQPIGVTHDIHENKDGAMKGKYVMNFPFGFVMEIAYSAYQDPVKAAQYIPMCQAQCCSEC